MRSLHACRTLLRRPRCWRPTTDFLSAMAEGKIWMEMSTTDEAEVRRLGEKVRARGGEPVDCPVSGGCHRADTGNISIFAGCERSTFERILPLLTTMGRRILHTGPLGSASILKVISNYLATANLVSCCEALVTAKAVGLDLNTTWEAMRISSGNFVRPRDREPGDPQRLARHLVHDGPREQGHRTVSVDLPTGAVSRSNSTRSWSRSSRTVGRATAPENGRPISFAASRSPRACRFSLRDFRPG